jgi:sacsin
VDRGLAEHQGPALLVYNDAQFSENDFTSLKRLGDSVKMDNKLATGKFGLGFNSVHFPIDCANIGVRMDRYTFAYQRKRLHRFEST